MTTPQQRNWEPRHQVRIGGHKVRLIRKEVRLLLPRGQDCRGTGVDNLDLSSCEALSS